jgi:glycerol-3-phosphate acyltransferase PlsY
MLENTEGVIKKDNPGKLATLDVQEADKRNKTTTQCVGHCYSQADTHYVGTYVACFSGLSFCINPSVFSNIYLSCVLYTYVASFSGLSVLLPLRYSLTFICPVSCVPYVASFSGLSFCISPSVFSNICLSCVLCTLCCQFLWIVLFHYPFGIL